MYGYCNYDKSPFVEIKGFKQCAWQGYDAVMGKLKAGISRLGKEKVLLVVECYEGVAEDELLSAIIHKLRPQKVIRTRDAYADPDMIDSMLHRNITEDRVFGLMCHLTIQDFFDRERLDVLRDSALKETAGLVVVFGTGSTLIASPDILVYADMARWEIQKRFRQNEISNWCADNLEEDPLRKYKRSFFINWRVLDRHKKKLLDHLDYLLDTNQRDDPKMLTGEALRAGYRQAAGRPFRVVPYFDPGVWGGQWMKQVCDLPPEAPNYAWCFDCVPEENSLLLKADGILVETPAINLVFRHPVELLGDKVHARFGTEFPIRFDMLDTIDGGNLSLQVHPLTEYIQEQFGMHYTQDESYYILEAQEKASVFLGVKRTDSRPDLLADLEQAQKTGQFDAEKYINHFPAKKHDHFLIPAGTIHCSGTGTMVLEISATPYIFTFKLWDWGRLGLDGLPRPVHLEHGSRNIQFERNREFVRENLIDRINPINWGDGWRQERTGLHEREFIETRRHWFRKPVRHDTCGGVNVINLVEGKEAVIESPEGIFEPFPIHYAETIIIPAAVGAYTIRPADDGNEQDLATIKAFVRT